MLAASAQLPTPPLLLLLLLATTAAVDGALIQVEARGYTGQGWTVSSNGCSTYGGDCQPVEYDDIRAQVGDTLVFRYAFFHDVFLSTLAEKNCDFTQGWTVGSAGAGGGTGFRHRLTEPGAFVFSCTRSGNRPGWPAIGTHCANGQVVKVVVTPSNATTTGSVGSREHGRHAAAAVEGGMAAVPGGSSAACDLDGTWTTTYQEVQIQGADGSYLGVWGALSDLAWADAHTLTGQFRNSQHHREGFFTWTFDSAAGCDSFTGQWGWDTAGRVVAGQWNGQWTSAAAPLAPARSPPPPPPPPPAMGSGTATTPGFAGPFVGMGISGHNDLGHSASATPADCAVRCAAMATCGSFDYGARGDVDGECWLSTANRGSAGHAYRAWSLYDYYEKLGLDGGMAGPSFTGEPDQVEQLSPLVMGVCLAVLGSGILLMAGTCYFHRKQNSAGAGGEAPAVVVRAAPVPLRGEVVSLSPPTGADGAGGGREYPVLIAQAFKPSDAAMGGGGGDWNGEETMTMVVRAECSV